MKTSQSLRTLELPTPMLQRQPPTVFLESLASSRHIKAGICASICIYTDILLGSVCFTLLLSAVSI